MTRLYKHIAMRCDVGKCPVEASHWVQDLNGKDTFYLCSIHKEALQNEEEEYAFISAGNTFEKREIGLYSCSDDCLVCNG